MAVPRVVEYGVHIGRRCEGLLACRLPGLDFLGPLVSFLSHVLSSDTSISMFEAYLPTSGRSDHLCLRPNKESIHTESFALPCLASPRLASILPARPTGLPVTAGAHASLLRPMCRTSAPTINIKINANINNRHHHHHPQRHCWP